MPEHPPPKRTKLRLGAVERRSSGDDRAGRRPSARRQELLEIAAEQFAARGFVNVTVDDLGAAAGVSGPALYHHFDSKEAMLGEMLVDISRHLLESARARRVAAPAERLLDDLIEMQVSFAVDHRALISVHFRDLLHTSADDQRRVRTLQREYVEIWVEALVVRHPELPLGVARPAVHAALGLVNSTPFSPRARRSDLVSMLRDMAHAALAAVGGASGRPDG